jgi:hypothetical protein
MAILHALLNHRHYCHYRYVTVFQLRQALAARPCLRKCVIRSHEHNHPSPSFFSNCKPNILISFFSGGILLYAARQLLFILHHHHLQQQQQQQYLQRTATSHFLFPHPISPPHTA